MLWRTTTMACTTSYYPLSWKPHVRTVQYRRCRIVEQGCKEVLLVCWSSMRPPENSNRSFWHVTITSDEFPQWRKERAEDQASDLRLATPTNRALRYILMFFSSIDITLKKDCRVTFFSIISIYIKNKIMQRVDLVVGVTNRRCQYKIVLRREGANYR